MLQSRLDLHFASRIALSLACRNRVLLAYTVKAARPIRKTAFLSWTVLIRRRIWTCSPGRRRCVRTRLPPETCRSRSPIASRRTLLRRHSGGVRFGERILTGVAEKQIILRRRGFSSFRWSLHSGLVFILGIAWSQEMQTAATTCKHYRENKARMGRRYPEQLEIGLRRSRQDGARRKRSRWGSQRSRSAFHFAASPCQTRALCAPVANEDAGKSSLQPNWSEIYLPKTQGGFSGFVHQRNACRSGSELLFGARAKERIINMTGSSISSSTVLHFKMCWILAGVCGKVRNEV